MAHIANERRRSFEFNPPLLQPSTNLSINPITDSSANVIKLTSTRGMWDSLPSGTCTVPLPNLSPGEAWKTFEAATPLQLANWPLHRFDQLLYMLSKGGMPIKKRIQQVKQVIRLMDLNGYPTKTYSSLRTVAILYARNGDYDLALKRIGLLNTLPLLSVQPREIAMADTTTQNTTSPQTIRSNIDLEIIEAMIISSALSNSVYSSHSNARKWFDQLRTIGISPKDIPWRIYYHMSDAYLTSHKIDHAAKWIDVLTQHDKLCEADPDIFVWLLNRSCTLGLAQAAMMWFGQIVASGRTPPPQAFTSLIYMWLKRGNIVEALKVRSSMKELEVELDRKANELLVLGLCREGRLSEARNIINDMRKSHQQVGIHIYTKLISVCNQLGLFDLAEIWIRKVFSSKYLKISNVFIVTVMQTKYMTMDYSEFQKYQDMFNPNEERCSHTTFNHFRKKGEAFALVNEIQHLLTKDQYNWQQVIKLRRRIHMLGLSFPPELYIQVMDFLLNRDVARNTKLDANDTHNADENTEHHTLDVARYDDSMDRADHDKSFYNNLWEINHTLQPRKSIYKLTEMKAMKAMLLFQDAQKYPLYKPSLDHAHTLLHMFYKLRNAYFISELYDITHSIGIRISVDYLDLVLPFMSSHNAYLDFVNKVAENIPEQIKPLSAECMTSITTSFIKFEDAESGLQWALKMYRTHGIYLSRNWLARLFGLMIDQGHSKAKILSRIATLSPPTSVSTTLNSTDSRVQSKPNADKLNTALVYLQAMQLSRGAKAAVSCLENFEHDGVLFGTDQILQMSEFCISAGHLYDVSVWTKLARSRISSSLSCNMDTSALCHIEEAEAEWLYATKTVLDPLQDLCLAATPNEPSKRLKSLMNAFQYSADILSACKHRNIDAIISIYRVHFYKVEDMPPPSIQAIHGISQLAKTDKRLLFTLVHSMRWLLQSSWSLCCHAALINNLMLVLEKYNRHIALHWVFKHAINLPRQIYITSKTGDKHPVHMQFKPSQKVLNRLIVLAAKKVYHSANGSKSNDELMDRAIEKLNMYLDCARINPPITDIHSTTMDEVIRAYKYVGHYPDVAYWEGCLKEWKKQRMRI
ncbi:hypothetical protein BDV3_000825 [Batrachochytrium dendrobatidis]